MQKFGVNKHDVSIRAIIEELSTHFAEDRLIICLVHRLPILRVMRESTFESTSLLVWFGFGLRRHPLEFVIDRLNTLALVLKIRSVFKASLNLYSIHLLMRELTKIVPKFDFKQAAGNVNFEYSLVKNCHSFCYRSEILTIEYRLPEK